MFLEIYQELKLNFQRSKGEVELLQAGIEEHGNHDKKVSIVQKS